MDLLRISQDRHLTPIQAGWIGGAFAWGYVITQILGAILAFISKTSRLAEEKRRPLLDEILFPIAFPAPAAEDFVDVVPVREISRQLSPCVPRGQGSIRHTPSSAGHPPTGLTLFDCRPHRLSNQLAISGPALNTPYSAWPP